MFKNYVITALRNLWKKKLFSAINLIGLSVGIACFFLITINVQDEFSYDSFHEKADQIYRVALERIYPDNVVFYAIIPHSIGEAMKADFPEVEEVSRIVNALGGGSMVLRYEDKEFEEDKFLRVDPNFFNVFSIKLLQGDPQQIFQNPTDVVITKETALRYFGQDNPLGKRIRIPNGEIQVTGVCENIPSNSHLEFDFLGSLQGIPFFQRPNYVSFSALTYVVLQEGASTKALEEKMPALVERYGAGQIKAQTGREYKDYIAAGNGYNYFLQPIQDIHLHSRLNNEIKPNGNIQYVFIMIAIAIFLIVIACINFMNLATARSASRAREVGIRKIMGSYRGQLIRQFMVESVVMALISMVFAAALAQLILPLFNNLTQKSLTINFFQQPGTLVLLLLIGIVSGVLAGSYPALFLSSFRPVTVLKGQFSTSRTGTRLRNGLVIFQFAISIILIAVTLLVGNQMSYIQNMDLGFSQKNVVTVERTGILQQRGKAFVEEIQRIPGVVNASGSNTTISGGFYYGMFLQTSQSSEVKTSRGMNADEDFAETMGLEIKQGRWFSTEFDDARNVVINEAAIKEFGWTDPIGMTLHRGGEEDDPDTGEYTVIGVVKDFHFNSLHHDIDSFVFFGYGEQPGYTLINVRINPDNARETLAAMETTWKSFTSLQPFKYQFFEETLNNLYRNEQTSNRLFNIFAILAIFIACIGLFGLSAFTAEQRTKEIGIRKVVGSSVSRIVLLLSRDFVRLVSLAFLIALPISYFAMHSWLKNFAFRTGIRWWVFLISGAAAILIAQLTISFQTIKAANADPVDSLHFE
ncbi:ABC transporter permease [Acidobacteriota bacterium]